MSAPLLLLPSTSAHPVFFTGALLLLAVAGAALFRTATRLDAASGRSACFDILTALYGVFLYAAVTLEFFPGSSPALIILIAFVAGIVSSALFRLRMTN